MYRQGFDHKFQSTIDRSIFSSPKVAIKFLLMPRWEVLNGLGVDGVGVIFPVFFFLFFFFAFFRFLFAFLRFSSLFFVFFFAFPFFS